MLDGTQIKQGACLESPADGLLATVAVNNPDANQRILIWDTLERLCTTPGSRYIHFAGELDGVMRLAMSANTGDALAVHSYKAALFDELPVPAGTAGCFRMKRGCKMMAPALEWKVARHESTCEDESE